MIDKIIDCQVKAANPGFLRGGECLANAFIDQLSNEIASWLKACKNVIATGVGLGPTLAIVQLAVAILVQIDECARVFLVRSRP